MNSQQKNGDQPQVKQNPPSLSLQEGGISVLNCHYDSSMFDYFAWYQKYPTKGPALLISICSVVDKNKDGRFTVLLNVSARHLSLHIVPSQTRDSFLYLCAVSPLQTPAACTQTCSWSQANPHFGASDWEAYRLASIYTWHK